MTYTVLHVSATVASLCLPPPSPSLRPYVLLPLLPPSLRLSLCVSPSAFPHRLSDRSSCFPCRLPVSPSASPHRLRDPCPSPLRVSLSLSTTTAAHAPAPPPPPLHARPSPRPACGRPARAPWPAAPPSRPPPVHHHHTRRTGDVPGQRMQHYGFASPLDAPPWS